MGISLKIRISVVLATLCQLLVTSVLADTEPVAVAVPKHFSPHYVLADVGSPQGFADDVFETLERLNPLREMMSVATTRSAT